jgi:hypothetical protein
MTTRLFLLSLCIAYGLNAQGRFKPVYHILRSIDSTTPLSIQNPLSDGSQVNILYAFVKCPSTADFQFEMDGTTAATGTNVSSFIVKGTKRLATSRTVAYQPSGSTSPRLTIPYSLPSAGTYPLPFVAGAYSLPSMTTGDVVASNATIRITTPGVTCDAFVQWEEP